VEKGRRRMEFGMPKYLPPRRKFGIMIWGCISYNGVGTLALVEGNPNANNYQDILESSFMASCC